MFTVSIDEATLGEIVRRLVEATDPDQIVMFGSRARGDARPDSDLDLLIINDSDEPRHRRAIPAKCRFFPREFSAFCKEEF